MTNFNLVDNPWIPVVDAGLASLRQVFENGSYRTLGGNPVQKVAVMKLLQAIGQVAAPVSNMNEWKILGADGLADQCIQYLENWYDSFFLYGEKPFLQMPAIEKAALQRYGAVKPDVATGNTTLLLDLQREQPLDDAEKALLLVCLMAFALGGKKVDNSIVLTPGYKGKKKSAKPGPAVASRGLLHSFVLCDSIVKTVWVNLITTEELQEYGMMSLGVGTPPWEKMPLGEGCPVAEELKQSLIGRLVPVCRFVLFEQDGFHYSEGIQHLNYLEGIYDPTVAADASKKKTKVLWADPEKRPWRQLPALLSFIKQDRGVFDCFQLRTALPKAITSEACFGVWSGGLKVSSNAGEQYVAGDDDFVESEVWMDAGSVGEVWLNQLQQEMEALEGIARIIYGCVTRYYSSQKAEGSGIASQASSTFWQLCEPLFQTLVDACNTAGDSAKLQVLRSQFVGMGFDVYNRFCPSDTARQLEAWAMNRPNLGKYLFQEGA